MTNNPIDPALARLREAARHWASAVSHYHDPEEFRIALNACIQAIRNVTFALQGQKKRIPGFEPWYENWQAALKADTVMKWCVAARNQIVKQQDLETDSVAFAALVVDYQDPPVNKIRVDPFANSRDVALRIREELIPETRKNYGYLYIERRWVISDLRDIELLEALAYALSVLGAILLDTLQQKGPTSFYRNLKLGSAIQPMVDGEIDEELLPEFARNFREARTTMLKLSSLDFVRLTMVPRETTPEELESARVRYRLDELTKNSKIGSGLKESVDSFLAIGKRMLVVDGHHLPKVFLFDRKNRLTIIEPEFPEHEDKPVIWNRITKQAKRERATSIIVIAESWFAPFDASHPYRRPENSPDRSEALQAAALTYRGQSYAVIVPFTRDDQKIVFGEETVIDAAALTFFEPFRKLWRKTTRSKANKPFNTDGPTAHSRFRPAG